MPPCLPGVPTAPGTPLNPGGPGSPMVWMELGSPFGPYHFNWIQKILYHSEFHFVLLYTLLCLSLYLEFQDFLEVQEHHLLPDYQAVQ